MSSEQQYMVEEKPEDVLSSQKSPQGGAASARPPRSAEEKRRAQATNARREEGRGLHALTVGGARRYILKVGSTNPMVFFSKGKGPDSTFNKHCECLQPIIDDYSNVNSRLTVGEKEKNK
jgi:hypothetical protein